MAGRYPHSLDKDSASMPPASASTPISYRANVNRQKTKKWAEAKPADYGGDDWGDDDEYDPPPPPVSKPTGLRQQGQALNSGPKPEPPLPDAKKSYGDLPPLPGSAPSPRPRVNSFDADDEKRNFSSGQAPEPSPPPASTKAPPTRFSQITGVPSTRTPGTHPALSISTQPSTQPAVTGLRKANPTPPPSGSAPPDLLQLGRVSTGDASSIASSALNPGTPSDYQARRDLSPSAVPHPLQTRASPEPPAMRLPGQNSGPNQPQRPDSSEITKATQETATQKPWANAQPASPSTLTPSTQSKALPFIRPADIYRRMEEAREKQRQSTESSRPSMDSAAGAKAVDRSESPAQHPQEAKQSDMTSRHGTGFEAEDASEPGRLKSTLDPVRERKSEYGFDGFQLNDPSGADTVDSPDYAAHDTLGAAIERHQSTSPQLPNLSRMSGFGMDFLSQSNADGTEKPTPLTSETTPKGPTAESLNATKERTLRSEPSLGFTSAVNQAFDRSDISSDASLPPTPASRRGTNIQRSESESTSTTGISPIMSRLPSAAIPASRNRDVANDSTAEHETSSLPTVKESTETQGPSEHVSNITIFKPGHRRDISTPTPGNSPAKTPDLTQTQVVPSGQQAVISGSSATPAIGASGSEQSIPPSLPGGWTSSEETRAPEHHLSDAEERNEKYDIMPSTAKRSPPQSSLETAAVGVSLGDVAGAIVGEHDKPAPGASLPQPDYAGAPAPSGKDEGSSLRGPKDGALEPSTKTQALPALTMDDASIDEQNDNLHKDIVNRLSSHLNSSAQGDLLAPENADDQASFNQTRISSYLPSEYENYWAASAEEEETPAPLATTQKDSAKDAATSQISPTIVTDSSTNADSEPAPPLNSNQPEQMSSSLVSPLSRRYSWEASTEDVPASSAGQGGPQLPLESSEGDRDVDQSIVSNPKPIEPTADDSQPHGEEPTMDHAGRDITLAAGGIALASSVGPVLTHLTDSDFQSVHRLSSIEEDGHTASPNPVLIVPSDAEQNDRSSQAPLSPALDRLSSASAARSVSPVTSQSAPIAKIPTFKEIVAIDSTQVRIKTFDETRQRFAVMDSGLSSWMETLKAQFPEHANVSASFGTSRMSGAGRSKYPGSTPGQQPYYQQYLNASSPVASGTPVAGPGTSAQASSQQGSSPASGNKLTTQQVQAKGKELLHTAGIFGGKAGKAGKGLLAKGKSRLRGGGDKNFGSQQSSWGLPRSSSRSNPPSRHSGEDSPSETSHRRRASTLTLDTHPAQTHRPLASNIMSAPGNLIAPWTTLEAFPAGHSTEPPPMPVLPPMLKATEAPDIDGADSSDESDTSAPVDTELASPDALGTVPAGQEEDSHDQEHQTHQPYQMQPAISSQTHAIASEIAAHSERSRKAVAGPGTHEKRSEHEWVLISSEVEARSDNLQQPNPPANGLLSNRGLKLKKSPDETLMVPSSTNRTRNRGNSSTSILDRPRYSYDIPRPEEPASAPQTSRVPPSVYFPSLINFRDQSLSVNHTEADDSKGDSKSENSFEGLPPIRRISGIGFDFNPQDLSATLPSNEGDDNGNEEEDENEHENTNEHGDEDEVEEEEHIDQFHALQRQSYAESSQAEIFAALRAAAGLDDDEPGMGGQQPSIGLARHKPQTPLRQPRPTRPPVPYAVSPMHSKDPLRLQRERKASLNTDDRAGVPTNGEEGFRRSEDARIPPPFASPTNARDVIKSPQRFSLATPSTQGHMRGENFSPRGENQDERAWRNSWTPQQPPSSAHRYPGLFRPPVPGPDGPLDADDLPPQYFQSAIPQVSAFIPRQQPGVGPPPDAEGPGYTSGFFKEIGERIRGASIDRGKSVSQDGDLPMEKNPDSMREYDDTDSSIVSEDGGDPRRGNNHLYAGFNRASTTAGSAHESMVAHPAASRPDLTLSGPSSPTSPNDRKNAVVKNLSPADPIPPVPPLPKPNRLAVLAASGPSEEFGKKKRFSGLTGMFAKSTNHGSKSSISESARDTRDRPSIEPPPEALFPKQAQILGTGPHSSPRTFLSRLTAGGEQPTHSRQDSKNLKSKLGIGGDSSQLKRDNKPRKAPGAGLLTGIMSRRQTQQDQSEETSSIRSKVIGPPIYHPPAFLAERTNTGVSEQSAPTQQQQPVTPLPQQNPQSPDPERERGRRMSKERQYPTVPIPGGYTLVRGEGATPIRTAYDPRGLNHQQQADLRSAQGARQNAGPLTGPQIHGNAQAAQDLALSQGSRSPNLTIESSEGSQRRDPRRLSRDDILARSPARFSEGQQRPYQLSLPGDKEDGEPEPAPLNNDVPIISPPRKGRNSVVPLSQPETAQVAIIQRMVHPALRNPQTPLKDDDVFSPANSTPKDTSTPSLPKWLQQKDTPDTSSKVERGNNKAQVVLGLSARVPSKPLREEDVLAPPDPLQKEIGARLDITPSPSPPSVGTPLSHRGMREHERSRESSNRASDREGMRIPIPEPKPSPDLYSASPRPPKSTSSTNHDSGSTGIDDKEVTEDEAARCMGGSASQLAELDDPESEMLKRARGKGEEKIPAEEDLLDVDDQPVTMSATSYPGQEWNPYADGVYEDFD